MPSEKEALSRIIQSEVGSKGTDAERLAVGWVARNRARKRKQTISRMAWPWAKQGAGRPFSSARAGTPASDRAAELVLTALLGSDPTGGATSCFQPDLQDRLFASGRYKKDATTVRASWLKEMAYYGSVGSWDLFGSKKGRGAQPTPAHWGVSAQPSAAARGSSALRTTPARLGGLSCLLLLLFGLASRRR